MVTWLTFLQLLPRVLLFLYWSSAWTGWEGFLVSLLIFIFDCFLKRFAHYLFFCMGVCHCTCWFQSSLLVYFSGNFSSLLESPVSTRVWNSHCTLIWDSFLSVLCRWCPCLISILLFLPWIFLSRLHDEKKSAGLLLIVTEILLYSKVSLL